jgi:putative transcriptional regulator
MRRLLFGCLVRRPSVRPSHQRRRNLQPEGAHEPEPAAFARYVNLTTGYVSQLERGTKQPKGPSLSLLNVIRRKGFEAIL